MLRSVTAARSRGRLRYDVSGFEAAAMNGARTSMDVLAAAGALESANMGKVLFWSPLVRT